nr:nucleoside recognition domain-containing protein [Rhodothermus marinus]
METFRTLIETLSLLVLPLLIVGFPLYGLLRRVPVYEAFVEGAREGFDVAVRIIPYLVAILFAIGMFRASGAMDFLIELLRPVLSPLRIPPKCCPWPFCAR